MGEIKTNMNNYPKYCPRCGEKLIMKDVEEHQNKFDLYSGKKKIRYYFTMVCPEPPSCDDKECDSCRHFSEEFKLVKKEDLDKLKKWIK